MTVGPIYSFPLNLIEQNLKEITPNELSMLSGYLTKLFF